tara:strand:- start:13538 stop:14278 length:741 start_codon:yes stop_codon:yes gene_type:complete
LTNPLLSIIIPAFNEESRIINTLVIIENYMSTMLFEWEVLIIDDGSTDNTKDILETWIKNRKHFKVNTVKHNGKGAAIKYGILNSYGKYQFMCDADLSMPIEKISEFIKKMDEGHQIVIGSRQIMGSKRFNEPRMRHILGRIFNFLIKSILINNIEDTQCGFKCFNSKISKDLFKLQQINGFAFDVEILFLAQKNNIKILELPINWYHNDKSKVRIILDPLLMARDIFFIILNNKTNKYPKFKLNN